MDTYELGPFCLDTHNGVLLRGSEPVVLGGRAVALLRALIEKHGALVSKDALIEAAWPGLAVEESNLPVQIAALRRALGETPGGDRWIETMPRRGYRFVGPVVLGGKASVTAALPQVDAPRDAEPVRHGEVERRQITVPSCELAARGREPTARVSKTCVRQPAPFSSGRGRPGVVGPSSAFLPRRRSSLRALCGGSGRRRISSPERGGRRSKQPAP